MSTIAYPESKLDKNHQDAIAELKECVILLSQEKQRWDVIHSNPVTDKWNVTYDQSGKMKIQLVMDDGIKNIINDQPIQREYILEPKSKQLLPGFDILFGAQLMIPEGPRPALGIGYRFPIFSRSLGVSLETSFTGLGGMVYYVPPQFPYTFIGAAIGENIWLKPTVAISIGLVF